MKKLRILVLTLFAVSVFIATVASVASAVETLLALWLANGVTFEGNLAVNAEGEVLMEDEKVPLIGKVAIACSGLFEGTVNGANGEGEAVRLWSLGSPQKSIETGLKGEGLLCKTETGCESSTTDIEAWPKELPVLTLLFLEEPNLFLVMGFVGPGSPGLAFEIKCLILGAVAEDECSTLSAEGEIVNVTSGVEAKGRVEPNGTCTEGGAGACGVEAIAGNKENLVEGGPLSASE